MRLWQEEQFGPVMPIVRFKDVAEVHAALKASSNGQQAAIFTKDPVAAAPLIDALSSQVGRININMQCGRSPDQVPFSGRRSSAMGTMSVSEALRAFSIETAVTYISADQDSVKLGAVLDQGGALTPGAILTPEILAGLLGLAALSLAAIPLRKRFETRAK
jgi:glyceraldehyde-3-phosphate dehydrogenase (NADP+)